MVVSPENGCSTRRSPYRKTNKFGLMICNATTKVSVHSTNRLAKRFSSTRLIACTLLMLIMLSRLAISPGC